MRDDLILLAKMVWAIVLSMMLYLVPFAGVELGDVGEWGLTGLLLAMVVRPGKMCELLVLFREELLFGIAVAAAYIYVVRGALIWWSREVEFALGLDVDLTFPGYERLCAPHLFFGVAMWAIWLIGRNVAKPAREPAAFDRK